MEINVLSVPGKKYYNGAFYRNAAAPKVMETLHQMFARQCKVRIFYGNTETGKVYPMLERHIGYVVHKIVWKVSSSYRVPVLLPTKQSKNGKEIFEESIVGIYDIEKKSWVYKHSNFHFPRIDVDRKGGDYIVTVDGEDFENTGGDYEKAYRIREYLTGNRNRL